MERNNFDDLKDVDFKKRFQALGADVNVEFYRNAFEYRITKDDRRIFTIRTNREEDRLFYTPKPDVAFFKNYTKEDLQGQLESNSPYMPHSIRQKLFFKLFECEQFPEYSNPLTLPERVAEMDKANISYYNKEIIEHMEKLAATDQLITSCENLGFLGKVFTKDQINAAYATDFKSDSTYYSLPCSVKGNYHSYLILRDYVDQEGTKSFVGAVCTTNGSQSEYETFKPIRRLDMKVLAGILEKFETGEYKPTYVARISNSEEVFEPETKVKHKLAI